jgi:hypothetical protein
MLKVIIEQGRAKQSIALQRNAAQGIAVNCTAKQCIATQRLIN